MAEQSEPLGPKELRAELSPRTLIVNKNKAALAGRCASTFADTGFAVEEQGYKGGQHFEVPADMFRDPTASFESELGNAAGHKVQLQVSLLDDLADINPLFRSGHYIRDDIERELELRNPSDQKSIVISLDDPSLTFYVVKRLPAYQGGEVVLDKYDEKYDTYVVKARFRSPTAETTSDKPLWTPPTQFVDKTKEQIIKALSEPVDYTYAQEAYRTSLKALEDPNNSQKPLPLFKTKELPTSEKLRLTPKEALDRLITTVLARMSQFERRGLPTSSDRYLDSIVERALESPEEFKDILTEALIAQYYGRPRGERFYRDPIRNGALFVDKDNELVSLLGAQVRTRENGTQDEGERYIEYDSYEILTGPDKGKKFSSKERPIPTDPIIPQSYLKGYEFPHT